MNTVDWGININNAPQTGIRTRVPVTSTSAGSYDLAPGGYYDAQRIIKEQSESGGADKPYTVNVTNVQPNHTSRGNYNNGIW